MRNISLFIAAFGTLLFGTTACSQAQRVVGSQNYTTKNIQVGAFNSLKLLGSPDIIYKQTKGKPTIQIYGSDNIIELVETKVENNTLLVKFKNNTNIINRGKLEVRVSGPSLNQISIQGSGDIFLTNGIKNNESVQLSIQGSGDIKGEGILCNRVSISISGSGDIELDNVKSDYAAMNISGSGDATLSGTCKEADFSISGSGDINAIKLIAEKVSARVSGSGDISCYATAFLKGGVSGSGEVSYKGNPQINFSKKGLHKW
ncbi:head GIN domain-containing protein [uncultured Bacteroides sp.]|uniref:head GIN domain-containing protein n=1 Tax=uncultured Bacteroides sp. TaxID=162156 RepID=UPI002AA5FEB7|nr:head GIN domain-containing protein [uncultured Bacteroides sp.]